MKTKLKYLVLIGVVLQVFLTSCQTAENTTTPRSVIPTTESITPPAGNNTTVQPESTDPLSRSEFMLGALCTIRLYDNKSEEILEKVFARIAEIEERVSSNAEGTDVDEISKNAGIQKVQVSDDTIAIIKKGLEFAGLSDGAFDITIGPLVRLWNIGFDDARVPEQHEIDAVLGLINSDDIEINEDENTVFLKRKGMRLDLGAVAKGYVADEVAKVLRENGSESAIIDLGGNIYTVGSKGDRPWVIGIQDPFDRRGAYVGTVRYSNKSFVTSGVYERYLEQDGVFYHHLLNPHTGYPFENNIAGVTIVSDYSVDGDALSTVAYSKDVETGLEMIETLENIEAIFVTLDRNVYISSGLRNNFILEDDTYKLQY